MPGVADFAHAPARARHTGSQAGQGGGRFVLQRWQRFRSVRDGVATAVSARCPRLLPPHRGRR